MMGDNHASSQQPQRWEPVHSGKSGHYALVEECGWRSEEAKESEKSIPNNEAAERPKHLSSSLNSLQCRDNGCIADYVRLETDECKSDDKCNIVGPECDKVCSSRIIQVARSQSSSSDEQHLYATELPLEGAQVKTPLVLLDAQIIMPLVPLEGCHHDSS
ncbi:hypothetical protein VNO78_22764 [Psophocarpus tetragonolobus]|uniref:Uncharacterized protein n=1 Tax=Psophocarpus tetragonolobus TaxID=3891 RepID=A0AAN9S3C9_PSOTE